MNKLSPAGNANAQQPASTDANPPTAPAVIGWPVGQAIATLIPSNGSRTDFGRVTSALWPCDVARSIVAVTRQNAVKREQRLCDP
jgi:hypothetical protein